MHIFNLFKINFPVVYIVRFIMQTFSTAELKNKFIQLLHTLHRNNKNSSAPSEQLRYFVWTIFLLLISKL